MLQLKIDRMVAGGDGLARDEDGRVVFVAGAMPGELVEVEITEDKKDFRRGQVNSVLEPSSDRVVAPCVHFDQGCGGCDWQYMSVDAQRANKLEIIRDSLRRIAKIEDAPIEEFRAVPDQGYRTTMRLAVGAAGDLQLHRRASSETLPIPTCLVAMPQLREVLAEGELLGAQNVSARTSAKERQTVLTVDVFPDDAVVPEHTSVVLKKTAGKEVRRYAQREAVGDSTWRVSPGSFFQSGPDAATLLVDVINQIVASQFDSEPIKILDGYSGIGILGGSILQSRNNSNDVLVAVEQNAIAAADASSNLSDLNAEVVNVEMSKFAWQENEPPDLIVADPGRPGLGAVVARGFAGMGPKVVILVSCDPASMARDISIFAEHQYTLTSVAPLDLFPHTSHVEAVSVLLRS